MSTELPDSIPLHVFRRLPSWSVYLKFNKPILGWYGCYAHLDYEYRDGAWELRLGLDGDEGIIAIPIELTDSMTLPDAVSTHNDGPTSRFTPLIVEAIKPMLSLLLYICSDEPDIEGHVPGQCPSRPTLHKVKGGQKIFAPPLTRTWSLGSVVGEVIREARQQGKTAGRKSPHIRRAHWHGYWTGPRSGERRFGYKWLPPLAINAEEEKRIQGKEESED